jgi:adenine-specific DNA-methyltransferase
MKSGTQKTDASQKPKSHQSTFTDDVFLNFQDKHQSEAIEKLFQDSVFTGFKKIDKNGTQTLREFSKDSDGHIRDNLIIKGNNLIVLYALKANFASQVKLIYIDPPYNTWNKSFQYHDRFEHSSWLRFMKNRLEIARELLRDDGAIFVQCDDSEQAYLKVLMDEIFGRENFKACITVKTSTPSWVNAVNVKRWERFFKLKEYILLYSKKPTYRFYPLYIKAAYNQNYRYEVIKNWDIYNVRDLRKIFDSKHDFIEYALKNHKNIYSLEKNNKKAWEKIKAQLTLSLTSDNVIEYINSTGKLVLLYRWWVFVPLEERIVREWKHCHFWTLISDFWDDEIFQSNKSEGWVDFSNAKKPEKLLRRILELWSQPWDIVLDYFLWSASTCAVAHKMGRQYIGIEQMDYIETIALERMKWVIVWEQSWVSKILWWKGWWSCIYAECQDIAWDVSSQDRRLSNILCNK